MTSTLLAVFPPKNQEPKRRNNRESASGDASGMHSNRARHRPRRAPALPDASKTELPRARKGALRALTAGKLKPETTPGAPVYAQAASPRSRNPRPPPKKKGKRRKSVGAFVSRRLFQRMAQWREQLSKRPDAASGLRFFEPEQHGVLRSRGVMNLGLYGVLDINAPGKRSQNKRRLYGESPARRFGLAPVAAANPAKPRPGRDQVKAKPRLRRDHAETNTNTTPARAKRRESNRSKSRKATERKHGRRRQAAPIAAQTPHARRRAPCRPSRARNHDFSFSSPRQRRPICRQASPLGGDDRTIDPAPKRRFGMARRRCARGMAGAI